MAISLFPFQSEAVEVLTAPAVHLALSAPTGSGKGVILEALAQAPGERILILSPLIALARQQRLRFAARGIPESRVRILSPESALLQSRKIIEWSPTLIAVDEAHCLPEWGRRFRPAYGRLLDFIRESEVPRTLWMSATFPRSLAEELKVRLPGEWRTLGGFQRPHRLQTEFRRVLASERVALVRQTIMEKTSPGILFTGTRKDVGRYLGLLHPHRPVLPYHAGLADEERRSVEGVLTVESRTRGARTSVIATNAFGMGMDFPQFDWALLAQIPFSLLALMQAFGRVGRGSRAGEATLFWAEEDFRFAGLLIGPQTCAEPEQHALARFRDYLEGDEDRRRAIETATFL